MIQKHHISPLEGEALENALKSDFGLTITNTEKITKGYSNQVYKGNLEGKTVFVRMNEKPDIFKAECLAYKIFEEQGIPVPKVIAFKENPPSIGVPTIILSSAEGKLLADSDLSVEQKYIVYENVGKLLKKINETKLEGYGPLKVENQKLIGEFSTWKEFWQSIEKHDKKVLDFNIDNKYITVEELNKINKIHREISELDFGKASLVHRDIHQEHFFLKGTDISGIIDLGSLTASDPRFDIAMSLFFQNSREQEAFKKGYGELAYDPMVNKYLAIIATRKIFFRSKKEEIKGRKINILLLLLKDALDKIQ